MTVYDARFLTATIRKDDELEAEPVTVYEHRGQGHLVLDDGTELVFDRDDSLTLAEIFSRRTDCEQLRKAG